MGEKTLPGALGMPLVGWFVVLTGTIRTAPGTKKGGRIPPKKVVGLEYRSTACYAFFFGLATLFSSVSDILLVGNGKIWGS